MYTYASVHRLLKMVEDSFGKSAKGNVDEIRADHLPCILIVYKMKGSVDIRNIIQGMAVPPPPQGPFRIVAPLHLNTS